MKVLKMNNQLKYYRQHRQLAVCLPLILIFLVISSPAVSQINYGGKPADGLKAVKEIPVVIMPEFSVTRYLDEEQSALRDRLKPMIFAKPFTLKLDPGKDGSWEYAEDGKRVWRIALYSRGAFSLNIIFSRFVVMPGVSVFVYNADKSHILGAFDRRNNQPSGSLALSPVRGDKIIVEMNIDKDTDQFGELVIGKLNHDFIGIIDFKDGRFGLSGECNIDVNCPQGNQWQTEKNAVARILTNGNQLCTGILVNNTANDGRPYLLTANHCIDDSTKAANTVFIFDYESPFCNGTDGTADNSLSGSHILATQENLDFTLLELREMPPSSYRPWFAGWDLSTETPENTFSIHHPNGDVKKTAIDNDPPETSTFGSGYTPNGHWKILHWDKGTTESGSSGSPLFDQNGSLRGLLTGGEAKCGNAVNDFFCKLSLAWDTYDNDSSTQLKTWLDPLNTGTAVHPGINPYHDNDLEADFTISTIEICAGDKVVFTDFSTGNPDSWYWNFGHGAMPAEAFTRGPHFVEFFTGGTRTVSLAVEGGGNSDLAEKEFSLDIKTDSIPVAGFSYTHDDLYVEFNDLSENADNYYWEFGDKKTSTQINPVNNYTKEGEYTVKQLVRNRACSDTSLQIINLDPNFIEPQQKSGGIKIYPVPAKSFIIVQTDTPFTEDSLIEMFSITGQNIIKQKLPAGQNIISIGVEKYPAGTYLLKIISGNDHLTIKIPIIR